MRRVLALVVIIIMVSPTVFGSVLRSSSGLNSVLKALCIRSEVLVPIGTREEPKFITPLKFVLYGRVRTSRLRGGGADGTEGNSEIDGALVRQLQSKRAECNNIIQKISSLEQERDDHDTAAGILQNFDVSRRCYRAVGGILMERTVADVVPELLGESRMLSKAMDDLVGKLKERQHDMEEFQEKHSLNMVGDGDDGLISHDSP